MTGPINLLVAYPYATEAVIKKIAENTDRVCFLLDSGAFSAWKLKITITLDEYCTFIEKLPFKPFGYFTLDVIGDPEGSLRNYETMRRRGFSPIPIVTRGDTLDAIDHYYTTADLVGFGGVTAGDKASYGWVKAIMTHVGKRRAHILGFTSMDWLKFTRPYSADSSSWMQAARYGTTYVYLGQGKMERIARMEVLDGLPNRTIMNRIRDLGFDPDAMQHAASWKGHRSLMSQLAATSWVACMIEMEEQIGTKLFLACPNDLFVQNVLDAHADLIALHPEFA